MRNKKTTEKLWIAAAALLLLSVLAAADAATDGTLDCMGWALKIILEVMMLMMYVIKAAIRLNPQIYCPPADVSKGCVVTAGVDQLTSYFIDLLVPLYIVAFLFTAAYFIVKSTNPRGRARAKMMLFKLFYSIVLVAFSPIILQVMLDMESMFTEMILNEGMSPTDLNRIAQNWTASAFLGAFCIIFIVYKLWWVALLVVLLRYLLVVLFSVMFPVFLFLYMFDLTRSWGRKYIKRTITWIFTPVIQAILLVLTVRSLEGSGSMWEGLLSSPNAGEFAFLAAYMAIIGPLFGVLLTAACMILFLLAPLITTKLLQYVGGGITAWGIATESPPIVMFGGILEGRGASSLVTAAGVSTRGGYYGQARSIIEGGVGDHPSAGVGGQPSGGALFAATGTRGGGGAGGGAVAGDGASRKKAAKMAEEALSDSGGTQRTRGGWSPDSLTRKTRGDELYESEGRPPEREAGAGEQPESATMAMAPPPLSAGTVGGGYGEIKVVDERTVTQESKTVAEITRIGGKMSGQQALESAEVMALMDYSRKHAGELSVLAHDEDARSLLASIAGKKFENEVQKKLMAEEVKQQMLKNRIAAAKLGNYLKRHALQKRQEKNG